MCDSDVPAMCDSDLGCGTRMCDSDLGCKTRISDCDSELGLGCSRVEREIHEILTQIALIRQEVVLIPHKYVTAVS
jgi:hypothetical protein